VNYTYDAVGNRTSMTSDGEKIDYSYDSANRLLSAGGQSFEYDASGNMTKASSLEETTDYTYDGNNRLTSVNFSNETYARYSYDGLDRLVRRETSDYGFKILDEYNDSVRGYNESANSYNESAKAFNETASENNGKTEKTNNGNDKVKTNNGKSKEKEIPKGLIGNENANSNAFKKFDLEEVSLPINNIESERFDYIGTSTVQHKIYSDSGSPMNEYYYANGEVVAQKMFGLKGRITPGKEETIKTNGGLMYYEYDGLGSVTTLRNKHGDTIEDYRYDVYGNIQTGITSPYNMTGYTGQMYDEKSSLVYMNARWYNPSVGRFVNEDTWKGTSSNPQTQNKYAYVLNNPVNYTDPSGNVPKWVKNRSDHSYKTHDTGDSYMGHDYVYKGESTSGGSWDPNPTRTYETYIEKSYSRSTTTTINYKYYRTGNTYNEEYGWSSIGLSSKSVSYKIGGSQSKTERIYAYEIAADNQRLIETTVGEINLEWNEAEKPKHDYSQDASTLTLEMIGDSSQITENSVEENITGEQYNQSDLPDHVLKKLQQIDNEVEGILNNTNQERYNIDSEGKVPNVNMSKEKELYSQVILGQVKTKNIVSGSINLGMDNGSVLTLNAGTDEYLESVNLKLPYNIPNNSLPQLVVDRNIAILSSPSFDVNTSVNENVTVEISTVPTIGIDELGVYVGSIISNTVNVMNDDGTFSTSGVVNNETRVYPSEPKPDPVPIDIDVISGASLNGEFNPRAAAIAGGIVILVETLIRGALYLQGIPAP